MYGKRKRSTKKFVKRSVSRVSSSKRRYGPRYGKRAGHTTKSRVGAFGRRKGSGYTRVRRPTFAKAPRLRSGGAPKSSKSSLAKATAAFRTQQVIRYHADIPTHYKFNYGTKGWFFLSGLEPADCEDVLGIVKNIQDPVAGVTQQYCAVRNFEHKVVIRNVASYKCKMIVRTWVARGNIPYGSIVPPGATTPLAVWTSPFSSIPNMMEYGANEPFVTTSDGAPQSFTDVGFSPMSNPIWVKNWKCIKTKRYDLMPWASTTEKLTMCKKRPGWIWQWGSAYTFPIEYDSTVPAHDFKIGDGYLAVKNMGGITTCYKTIEFVGEDICDATGKVATSPVVILTHEYYSFEAASAGPSTQNWTEADPDMSVLAEGQTGQTFNYMYPGAASSSSQTGYSSLAGSLVSGL